MLEIKRSRVRWKGRGRTRITWFMVERVADVEVNERVGWGFLGMGRERESRIEGVRKRRRVETAMVVVSWSF